MGRLELRVLSASLFGLLILVLEIVLAYTIGTDFGTAFFLAVFLPPFFPILTPTVIFSPSGGEGTVVGFVIYLVLSLYLGTFVIGWGETGCYHVCGIVGLSLFFTPILGAGVGAVGGRIGGWRMKRRNEPSKAH